VEGHGCDAGEPQGTSVEKVILDTNILIEILKGD
jgi:hypothetical protein